MNTYFPYLSTRKNKKFMILTDKHKWVHFGDSRYEHYTEGHLDENRRDLYQIRHRSSENWRDPDTAGFWSYWFLWRYKTYEEALKHIYRTLKNKNI